MRACNDMRVLTASCLLLVVAGCATEEISRSDFRPDGSEYVSGGLGAKRRPEPSFFERLFQGSGKTKAARAAPEPKVIRGRPVASISAAPATAEPGPSFWDWLLGRDKSESPTPPTKDSPR